MLRLRRPSRERQDARPQRRDQRRMAREHAEIALDAGTST